MPAELLTNAAPVIGSLAMLLSPTPAHKPAETVAGVPPAADMSAGYLFGDWFGARSIWSDNGLDFTVQYIGEVAGNVSGGVKRGTVYNGLLYIATDLDLEKSAGWKGGLFHGAMLATHGRSLTDNYVNDLFVESNLDASDNLHLFELWLEQNFTDGKLSVRVGQMAVDQEFAYTDQGALFNNAAFGWFPIVGATAPVYPQGAPGVRLKWQPSERGYLQIAVTDGDVNPADAAGNETNPHGIEFRFDEGALIISEAGFNWSLANDTKSGSMKLGCWYHTADTEHVRLDNTGLSLADPLTSGTPATLGKNWGIYVGAEQVLWNENPDDKESSQGLGAFCRWGYAPSDRNTLGHYLEAGFTRTGLLPGCDDDVCGLGVAYGRMSHDLRDLGADANFFNATSEPLPDYELVVEAEYQINVRPGLTVQPGVQYIIHPGGSSAIDNALVLSFRTIIEF